MNRIVFPLLVAVITVVGWSPLCSAQANCDGVLSGLITSDVICTGDCTLEGADITGSVQCSTGNLVAKGNTNISGSIQLTGDILSVKLEAVAVLGGVEVKDAESLVELQITEDAALGSVKVENTGGDVIIAGSINGLELINSGNLFVNNLVTLAEVSVKGGNGIIEICGFTLGGLSVEEHTGDVDVDANRPNCNPSVLIGGLSASKGTGSISVRGADFPSGDFTVTEYTGDVVLQETQVSDINLEKNEGTVTLNTVFTDSDVSIIEQDGDVVLQNLNVTGDFNVILVEGDVTLTDSTFNLEDISVTLISGTVTVVNNVNLNLKVEENDGLVQISGNTVVDAGVNKNTGGVTITNNVFEALSCSDNDPAPTGSDNTILFPDGQCATGL